MLSNMRPTRFLDVSQFYKNYRDEIEYLYTIVFNNLNNRDIFISNENEFHKDFINYVYKYSFKYKSNFEP
jgi:hypothetical protein